MQQNSKPITLNVTKRVMSQSGKKANKFFTSSERRTMSRTPSPALNLFFGPVIRTSVMTPASPAAMSLTEFTERGTIVTPCLPSPQQRNLSVSPVSQQSFVFMMQNLSLYETGLSPQRQRASAEEPSSPDAMDERSDSLSSDISLHSSTARPEQTNFPVFPEVPLDPPVYRLREATVSDVEGLLALTSKLDMTHATSFMWPRDELIDRITRRDPLVVVAVVDGNEAEVAGCAGIDTLGMGNKQLTVYAVGSRVAPVKATEHFTFPSSYCNCRGLLIHPNHQGAGLGSRLHRTRLELLAQIAPSTPAVVLSARGTTFEEALAALGPLLQQPRDDHDATPQFTKDTVFEFTFQTSKGIVHLAHHRESDGWRFAGVDVADGGPVWVTAVPIVKLVETYPASRRPTAVFLEPIVAPSTG